MKNSMSRKIVTAICSACIALTPVAGAFATVVHPSIGGVWDYGTHGLYEAWSVYTHPKRNHKSSVSAFQKSFTSQCVIKNTKAEAHIYWYVGRATMHYGLC